MESDNKPFAGYDSGAEMWRDTATSPVCLSRLTENGAVTGHGVGFATPRLCQH